MHSALHVQKLAASVGNGQNAEVIWTDDDMLRFAARATELGREPMVDGLRLAALTGLQRDDLVAVTWAQVGSFEIRKGLMHSVGKRLFMNMPRLPALDALLRELRIRHRNPRVETVLVNSYGQAWSAERFERSFDRIRDAAQIRHIGEHDGTPVKKQLCDVRGTFCRRLLLDCGLSDDEAASVMGWVPERVATIRRAYIDRADATFAMWMYLHGGSE
jgi:integrase